MRLSLILIIATMSWANVLNINIPAPEFEILYEKILAEGVTYKHHFGAPNLPCRTVTIAIPPGAIVDNVTFSGIRTEVATMEIDAKLPPVHLSDEKENRRLYELYENNKDQIYATNKIFPESYGVLQTKGGLRKYSLVTVDCYHFAYNPQSNKLYYAPNINVAINYHMPGPGSDRAQFWKKLRDDVTLDAIAKEKIYNWQDAQVWYHTDDPHDANGLYIIIPSSIISAVESLVPYRQSQGFDVQVVTTEHIDSVGEGVDLTEKIRNYLRTNMADIKYALFVGYITDMPMRYLNPINNHSEWWDIPSDLYFAELTDPDSLSWNSDRDSLYGEVFDTNNQPPGDDNPDYHHDIHVARIPVNNPSAQDICRTIIAFDSNTDKSYKGSALLPGSIVFYENQNHQGYPKIDGAEDMETLMDSAIINRANAIYLYEEAGLDPSAYPATDSLCKMNQIFYWNKKGFMYEYHHGAPTAYARTVWVWDDGDGVPEDHELASITTLAIADVYNINNEYSSTTLLRSCNCGYPDQYSLTMRLMDHGVSSSVLSGTRGVWVLLADRGGLYQHFLSRLMLDTTTTDGIVGDAFSAAKIDFMDITSWWYNAYVLNFYGDPTTKQLGRQIGVAEGLEGRPPVQFSIYPNPTSDAVTIHFQTTVKTNVELDIYDECGRFIQNLYKGKLEGPKKVLTKLPTGIYFLRYSDEESSEFKKVVIVR